MEMNGVAPELFRRSRHQVDTDDLALTFVEDEIGRFDFSKNWEAAKRRGNMQERIRIWLDKLNVDTPADELMNAIDRLVTSRPGRWV